MCLQKIEWNRSLINCKLASFFSLFFFCLNIIPFGELLTFWFCRHLTSLQNEYKCNWTWKCEQILCWFLFHCRLWCSSHQNKSHITYIQAWKTISEKTIIHQSTFAARHLCSTLVHSGKHFFYVKSSLLFQSLNNVEYSVRP